MTYILLTYAIVVTILAKYFYDKWKEHEALVELSKSYDLRKHYTAQFAEAWAPKDEWFVQSKLNKDGTPRKPRSDKGKKRK